MDRKVSMRRRRYKKRWTEKCKDYFRSFLAFMFSNVGIIGLVIGYTIAGAFIFIEIEGHTEKSARLNIQKFRNATADAIWMLTNKTNILEELVWKKNITRQLIEYQKKITRAIRTEGFDGSDNMEISKSWNIPGAFLYCLTVITTIGYGNVVPRTEKGKIATIIYAIVGMPLFLLYLSNIGDVMARSFKWFYAKICLCKCCPGVSRKRAERQRRRAAAEEFNVEYYNNRDGSESPEASIRRGSYQNRHRLSYEYGGGVEDDESENQTETMTEVSYDTQAVTVPLTICLAMMVGYILGGALLFSEYEGEWTTLDGSYFCFISLSTIGFGDFVPGKAIYSDDVFRWSSIFCSMYLMLGMALIAMCFNLMQEDVIQKIRTIVRTVKYIFRCNR